MKRKERQLKSPLSSKLLNCRSIVSFGYNIVCPVYYEFVTLPSLVFNLMLTDIMLNTDGQEAPLKFIVL